MEHPTRRVFAAFVPPLAMREELALRLAACEGVRWTPASNMHVTLIFDPACVDPAALIDGLASAVLDHEPFRLILRGEGAFETRRGSTLWLAAGGATEADQARLRKLRVAAGSRADAVGHLTLARVRERAAIAALPAQEWKVDEVKVYESKLGGGPGGRSRYDLLARLPLGRRSP